jgi:hypothetical protein
MLQGKVGFVPRSASALTLYSEEGAEYEQKVTRSILQSNLQRFNKQFNQSSLIATR